MLRESSAQESVSVELRGLTDEKVDLRLPGGNHLRALAGALLDRQNLDSPRASVVAMLGEQAAVTAVGVVSNFQMMNRALDAVGIPAHVDRELADALGVDPRRFGGAHGET